MQKKNQRVRNESQLRREEENVLRRNPNEKKNHAAQNSPHKRKKKAPKTAPEEYGTHAIHVHRGTDSGGKEGRRIAAREAYAVSPSHSKSLARLQLHRAGDRMLVGKSGLGRGEEND